MKKLILTLKILTTTILIFASNSITIADNAYQRFHLPKGVSLEIPKSFLLLSDNEKIDITAFAESLYDDEYKLNVLNFAANHYDSEGNTDALVNIRFYPNNPYSQMHPKVLRYLDDELKELELSTMNEMYNSTNSIPGMKIIQWNGVSVQEIGGLVAVVTDYRRSIKGDSSRVRLIMFHNLKDSFHMTVSYDDKENNSFMLKGIINQIIKSLQVK